MSLSRPLQGNPLKIRHLLKPRMSFPGSCDDYRHLGGSCTQTRGHQCFRVDSDAGARFKIKFPTPRARACQPLHGKHLPPAGKATPGGEPWLSSRSAQTLLPTMRCLTLNLSFRPPESQGPSLPATCMSPLWREWLEVS